MDSNDERAVLGDELQQRGEPQGELISLCLALEALPSSMPPVRARMIERRIAAVLDAHHDRIYGPLAPHVSRASLPDLFDPALLVKKWVGGFADTIWIQARRNTFDLPAIIRSMRELPIARFVRRLEIGRGDLPVACAHVESEPMPSLRELVIGDGSRPLPQIPIHPLASTKSVDRVVQQLEALEIGQAVALTPLSSPTLKTLSLSTPYGWNRVFDAELPAIEELTLYGFTFDRAFVDRYPELRRATLSGNTPAPGWFEHFVRSPMFMRLERLALGGIADPELAILARYTDRLANMKLLDLTNCYFSPQARQAAGVMPACVSMRP